MNRRVRLVAVLSGVLLGAALGDVPAVQADAAHPPRARTTGGPHPGHYAGWDAHHHRVTFRLRHGQVTHLMIGHHEFPGGHVHPWGWDACGHGRCSIGGWVDATHVTGQWHSTAHPDGVDFHAHWEQN